MILSPKKRYLQIAINSSLNDGLHIISRLPVSDRILIEAGTPFIKQYGMSGVTLLYNSWYRRLWGSGLYPYLVADLKTIDRAEMEVKMAKEAGASGVICMGLAPPETVNVFISACEKYQMDSMIDMMNVEFPIQVLRNIKKKPDVVLLHRGVDEETYNKDKSIPYVQINKVLSLYNVMISIAGGDTPREVQRAIFNNASIVVVWKDFYSATNNVDELANNFLKEIK
ncbi:MAG: orotidine 5'-phosphate decarboxylase / HUMPS family protein [Candidatus Roizmanbacteria bacterium]